MKSTPSSHPDKIRPINKTSARPAVVVPIQSPSKSSTTSSINTDVPQIEINSPSPNSPGFAPPTKTKPPSREQFEPQQQRFGYDAYMKQADESTSHMKSPNTPRKATKAANTISPIKQRDHLTESKRSIATPINGSPSINKNKMSSPRHTSTSSEEQHIAPPTPMKAVTLKDQLPTAPPPLSTKKQLFNKTNQPARLFIALFDYDPNAMSPNKDNDEELPFKEGQLIRVRSSRPFFSLDSSSFGLDLRRPRCRWFLHWRDRKWPDWLCAE